METGGWFPSQRGGEFINQYQVMRNRQQKEVNALPMRFAFSQEQFHEVMKEWGLDPKKDLDKIARIPWGGFIQKKDAPLMHETFARHHRELQAAMDADPTGEGSLRICSSTSWKTTSTATPARRKMLWTPWGSPSRMWRRTPGWPLD